MKTPKQYYQDIIDNRLDLEHVNFILNCAIRDSGILSADYKNLCTTAKSLGFKFGMNFELVN